MPKSSPYQPRFSKQSESFLKGLAHRLTLSTGKTHTVTDAIIYCVHSVRLEQECGRLETGLEGPDAS